MKQKLEKKQTSKKSPEETEYFKQYEKAYELFHKINELRSKGLKEKLKFLEEQNLISRGALNTIKQYYKRQKEGYNVSINGEKFGVNFSERLKPYLKALEKWSEYLVTHTNYTQDAYKKLISHSKKIFSKTVSPARDKMESDIKRALKIQAYFGAPQESKAGSYKGPRAIRMKILSKLNSEFPGCLGGYAPKENRWARVTPRKMIKYLNNRLMDLFMIESYTNKTLKSFIDDMPDLASGELNLDAVLKAPEIDQIYEDVKRKFKSYFSHFKPGEREPEKNVSGKLKRTETLPPPKPKQPVKILTPQERKLLYEDAKSNLESHWLKVDDKNGRLLDENGKLLFETGDIDEFKEGVADLSRRIDRYGYETTMKRLKRFLARMKGEKVHEGMKEAGITKKTMEINGGADIIKVEETGLDE